MTAGIAAFSALHQTKEVMAWNKEEPAEECSQRLLQDYDEEKGDLNMWQTQRKLQ